MPITLQIIRPYVFANLYFTIGTSVVTGVSNSIASAVQTSSGFGDLLIDFFQAGGGNLGLGLVVNFIPASFNQRFSHSDFFWMTGNLMMVGMNALMLGFQYAIQTENPIESRLIPTIASQSLQNLVILRTYRKSNRA